MNFKVVFKIVGRVITMESFVMLVPMFVAALYGEDITPFLMSIILVLFLGVILNLNISQHY